ncbi:MAG: tetratricopeptide repeat protein [Pedosphaera sp.]|nr:tetratricopeptide repeat protein [Pedosphaera sp.]
MVPRAAMLAIKNPRALLLISFLGIILLVSGCMPAGPRALLDGKKLLEQGRYPQAVEKLTFATSLMKTNAAAWNYLGLARHRAGDAPGAAKAYGQALLLDRELFEARYNLGCLLLEQNKADLAKSEFTACTLRRPASVEAWVKLGTAQYRLGELASAEESFHTTLRLSANNVEAFNGLGLVNLQRKRPRDAAQYFALALKQQTSYRPALLNLATVSHRQLNDPVTALQRYREYLALVPREDDWPAVNALAQALEQQLAVAVRPATVAVAPPSPGSNVAARATTPAVTPLVPTTKTSAPPVIVKTPPPPPPPAQSVPLPPEPVIKIAPTHANPSNVAPAPSGDVATKASASPSVPVEFSPPPAKTEKRGFFSRLNPFRSDAKPAKKSPPPEATVATSAISNVQPPPSGGSQTFPRYAYSSPAAPAAGNRAEAERAFAQGTQAQSANRHSDAAKAFGRAVELDGSYFDARYNLGLEQYGLRNYPAALATWERALATRPDSTEARYNFALTLKAAGHAWDAAAELEKILMASANDVRSHLVLGNLYAEQLRDVARARTHYQRVLDLDSKHPQSTAIRYWMVANPP